MTDETASFHTPEELLAGAQSLLDTEDPAFARAAILEAIAALEAYVEHVVFDLLETKLEPLLVSWLRERTKMDFDSRLSVLVPIATERSVTKATDLWSGYKKGKSIRNAVTHTGRQVTLSEAKEVLKTVFDWLSHLGSTAELDVLLLRLKSHIESTFDWQAAGGGTGPDFWSTYERNVRQYFAKVPFSHVETNVAVPLSAGALFEVDFLVTIGSRQVAIEVKRASANPLKLDEQLQATTQGVYRLLAALKIDSAVVVLLFDVVPPEKYRKMEKRLNGRVTILPTVMRLRR